MAELSHTDNTGNARMVNVGNKEEQYRIAVACGFIRLQKETMQLIANNKMKKGDVLAVAKIAGIQAAKQTPLLIPLCHPLTLDNIEVVLITNDNGIEVISTVSCIARTGVEMEAITAASVALITIYDMCKSVDKEMVIENVRLLKKEKIDK